MAARQLALALTSPQIGARRCDVIGPASAEARALLGAWRTWPTRTLALIGPPGSGKSHLAQLWAEQTGAVALAPGALGDDGASALAAGQSVALVLDDVTAHAGAERALLAVLDAARAGLVQGVLLTAASAPADWPFGLPDLRSRVTALPQARLADPDSGELRAAFAAHLAARGLDASDALIGYVLTRIERSFAAAAAAAAALDACALELKTRATVRVARIALGGQDEAQQAADGGGDHDDDEVQDTKDHEA